MAQIRPVTSEALEAQIRDLLPSQNGFSEDLQATNVITPIIDLTRTAEGSDLDSLLQNAWDFATIFVRQRGTGTSQITNTAGFYKVMVAAAFDAGGANATSVELTDGLTTKTIWAAPSTNAGSNPVLQISNVFYVFLRSGDTLNAIGAAGDEIVVSARQVADVNGNLVDPIGFTPQ